MILRPSVRSPIGRPVRLATVLAAAAITAVASTTWASLGVLGMNTPPLSDWDKSHPFVDLMATARAFYPYNDPFGTPNASVKANGQPAEDFAITLLDNGVPTDEGAYLCGFSGTGTPEINSFDGSITGLQTVGGITTFTINRFTFPPDSADPRISVRFSGISADFGDTVPLYVLRVGVPRGTGQVWGADWMASLQGVGRIRFMNWLETNGSQETGLAGSLAFNNKPYKYGARISTQADLCNRLSANGWWNTPALADAELRTAYVTAIHSQLNAPLTAFLEHANEPWNTMFAAWLQGFNAVKAACQSRTDTEIVSLVRASGVITAELQAAHGKSVGDQVSVAGAYSNANGEWVAEVVTLIAGTAGTTLVWNSSQGGSDTADIVGGTTIHLNPTHPLCAPTAHVRVPSIWEAKENWDITQTRANFTAISGVSGASARIKPALGLQLDSVARVPRMMQWAIDNYGSANWCVWAPAYYAIPAEGTQPTLDTEQKVKDSLEAARLVARANLWRFKNICLSFGVTNYAVYEMGPHNDQKTEATEAAVAAVHASDWMRLFVKQMLQDVRDILGAEACYFQAGAIDTYGTTTNNTWAVASPNMGNYANSAKWKAVDETMPVSFIPEPIDGITWGALDWIAATNWIYSTGAGNLILVSDAYFPDLCLDVCAPSDGAFPLTINANCNWGGDRITILIDDTPVASNVLLPDANPYVDPAGVAWSGTVNLTKGSHKLTVRLAAVPRGAQIGLGPAQIGT